jgi:sulfate permease, SulP family
MARTRYANPTQESRLRDLPAAAMRAVLREGYAASDFRADLMAGLVVGVVALPLAMALAIAVGVPPQHGLYTAIMAGAVVALLGGSRTQVSGPTAAFVVILAPVYTRFGLAGLLMAGLLAGLILIGMGLLRLGKLIQFIPHPVTTGFTAGIAVVIAVLQVKDLLGLRLEHTPEHFAERVEAMVAAGGTASPWELAIGLFTLALLLVFPRLTRRVPAPLVALSAAAVLAAVLARLAGAEIATIASRFHTVVGGRLVDGIPQLPPLPVLPWLTAGPGGEPFQLTFRTLQALLPSAFAIAMLGAIESLLSAVVADGMARTRHDPDAELLAAGVGNVVAPFFGGIPATGAIARTATNIRSGARSPVAAVIHALVVLAAVVVLAPALGYLPMSALAALLLLVAWNMSEAKHFIHTVKVAPRSDVAVLLTCFGLTVFTDMVIGVGVGMVLAAMLFMRRMAAVTEASLEVEESAALPGPVPSGVVVYRVSGPLFFGAAQKAMGALGAIADRCRVMIFRLDQVPVIDATGMVALESAVERLRTSGITAILHGLRPQPREVVDRSGLLSRPGVLASDDWADTLRLAGDIVAEEAGGLATISSRLTAADVMSREVAFVAPTASLREVVETMLVKGRRAVPVVEGGRVVGIISNGDLVQRGGLGVRLELLRGLAWSDVHAHLEGLAGAAKTAADVMTARPVTVQVTTPLRRVARRMAQRRLKRLPVVDHGGGLAGMVSRVDLLRATAGLARAGEEAPALAAVPGGARVASIMRTDVPAVAPEAPLPEVLRAIVSTRLNKALVLDGDRRVLGLITDAELMDRLSPSLRPGLLRSLMQPLEASAGDSADPAARHAQARRASELMTTDVPAVTPETPLTQAIASMLEADRKILAVVDGEGRLVGVVDRADLLRGIAAQSGAEPAPAAAPAP